MTLNRIDHFVITTKNLCQCLHFYVDILGMEHKIQREENDQHTLHFGNQKINIHTYVGEFQPTAKHAERGCADFCLITKYSLQGTTQGNGLTGGLPPVRFSM